MTSKRRKMQQSQPMLVLSCHVGAELDEELCNFRMPMKRRVVQQSPQVLVLGCDVGAVFYE
jgi:hypothetical protein